MYTNIYLYIHNRLLCKSGILTSMKIKINSVKLKSFFIFIRLVILVLRFFRVVAHSNTYLLLVTNENCGRNRHRACYTIRKLRYLSPFVKNLETNVETSCCASSTLPSCFPMIVRAIDFYVTQ